MKTHFSASDQVDKCLQKLGRTEDIAISPSGARIAIAGFAGNTILLLDLTLTPSGKKSQKPVLTGAVEVSSPGLSRPHGLAFINESLLVVANREGDAPILELPAAGTATGKLDLKSMDIIPGKLWLHSPGSVCSYMEKPGRHVVLICNNYADYITRHTLDIGQAITASENTLILAGGLELPDGIAVSQSGRWIAISNHEEQAVRLYANDADLCQNSEPSATLHGVIYPHGLLFTRDERFVVVADAGAPFLRIYMKNGKDWQGNLKPALSLRVMSDERFSEGNYNSREGGIKGIALVPGTSLIATTSEHMPLAFFDLEKALLQIGNMGRGQKGQSFGGGVRCPCGSKKPFLKCCGKEGTALRVKSEKSLPSMLREATEKLQSKKLDSVEALCLQALALRPDHPKFTHILGFTRYMQSRYDEASNLIRAAGIATHWHDLVIHYHYAKVLSDRLKGSNTAQFARLRCAYDQWKNTHTQDSLYKPLVSIVIVDDGSAGIIEATLDSILAQSYPNMEIVIAYNGPADNHHDYIAEKLQGSRLSHEFLALPRQSVASALNEAIRTSTGDYINPVDINELMHPERITELVEHIAQKGFGWGFGASEVIESEAPEHGTTDSKYVKLLHKSVDSINSADTVGSTLLGLANPSGSLGNLFFSRSLFERIDGFRDLDAVLDRDFCLRALWIEEPYFVASASFTPNMSRMRANGYFSERAQSVVAQLLADYCDRAERESPPNNFAPARSTMGFAYLAGALSGNQTRLPPSRLLMLHDELDQQEQRIEASSNPVLGKGINLVGFFRGDFGLGEAVRGMANICHASDIETNLLDAGVDLEMRQSNRSCDHLLTDCTSLNTTLFYLTPDHLGAVWRRFSSRGALRGRRTVGYWHWEIEQFPHTWRQALDMVDEVWVASDFVGGVVRRATEKPVITIPCPIEVQLSRAYARSEFSLPEDRFLFLFSFDFSSYISRKNPWATIEAFRLAFQGRQQDVGLVIKCFNGRQHPEESGRLHRLAEQDPRIQIIDSQLSRNDMYGLQSLCDAYVSLHRAEGLGLGMAECMALGKPVIATDYSGNLQFMNRANSCLVDYSLIPVKPGEYIDYEAGWMWADPNVEDAARHMIRLVSDNEYRRRISAQAAQDIATYYSPEVVARAIKERISLPG